MYHDYQHKGCQKNAYHITAIIYLELLPSVEFLLHRIGHLYAVCPVDEYGIFYIFVSPPVTPFFDIEGVSVSVDKRAVMNDSSISKLLCVLYIFRPYCLYGHVLGLAAI